jgi:hypothetical protein
MMQKVSGRALVFTYRRLSRFFHEVARRTFAGEPVFCSSWPGLEDINIQEKFYEYYRQKEDVPTLTAEDYEQIIMRSCVLRLLPRDQSVRMVNAMYRVIDRLTDQVRPDYLFTVSVDNYMTDLLARVCRRKQVRLIMLMAGAFPNTILLTSYGEFNMVREPPEEEVERVLRSILDDGVRVTYASQFSEYTFWRHLRVFGTWWLKCLGFRALGFALRDPLNFRFLMGSLPTRDGQSSLWAYRCVRYFHENWEERILRSDRKAIFMPLSYTPEASVSYWLRDLGYIDYESFVLKTCESLRGSCQVVVKEHWAALGVRRHTFYEQLMSIPEIVVVPAEVNSRYVMSKVDAVLVGAGTAGIEAAVRGKQVCTLDAPYYFLPEWYLNIGSSARVKELPLLLESCSTVPPSTDQQRSIVRRALQGTLVGHFVPDSKIDSVENFETTSKSLMEYLSP